MAVEEGKEAGHSSSSAISGAIHPDLPGLGDWQRLDEVVADVSRLWWLKE